MIKKYLSIRISLTTERVQPEIKNAWVYWIPVVGCLKYIRHYRKLGNVSDEWFVYQLIAILVLEILATTLLTWCFLG